MIDYFDDKTSQIDCLSCVAFGIPLVSRHGKAIEMIEMLSFALGVATEGLHPNVENVFYDSNACCCEIKLSDDAREGSETERMILNVARKSISQFLWFGMVYHGDFIKEEDEEIPS